MSLILRPALAAFAFVTLLAVPAMAETVNFKAAMNGATEVPPNQSKGTGAVTATYDTATKKLTYKGNYSGLSGDATMAHFHGPAEAGKNAPPVVTIKDVKPSFEGTADLTDAQAADLMGGRWYVNVHTAANPTGEIRGQVTK